MKIEAENYTNDKNFVMVWGKCLEIIKKNVTPMTFSTWFEPINPLSLENNKLRIELPGSFHYDWIAQRYSGLMKDCIEQVIGQDGSLEYVINEKYEEKEPPPPLIQIPMISKSPVNEAPPFESNLNKKYTFQNFVKGGGNQLASAAAFAIGDAPGKTAFNPLYVYGGVGLGKTHLAQAIGNKILENFPDHRVIYISTDQFTVKFVEHVLSNKINEFQNFYLSMDTIILDDIQFLSGKTQTQDLFFNIFNSLHQKGKQIVLTSDKPPKDIKGITERLISRFHWGLSVEIEPPEYETRLAILNKKTDEFGLFLSQEALEYIATHITSNIRELEGCLLRLLANMSLANKPVDLDLVKHTVRDISTTRKIVISVDSITRITCEHFRIDENKVRDKTRKQEVVIPRQVAMYLSKEMTTTSLKNIGLYFGGRDHSTVIHACTSVQNMIETDNNFKETVHAIKKKIEIACS